jgi:hypothetical protein
MEIQTADATDAADAIDAAVGAQSTNTQKAISEQCQQHTAQTSGTDAELHITSACACTVSGACIISGAGAISGAIAGKTPSAGAVGRPTSGTDAAASSPSGKLKAPAQAQEQEQEQASLQGHGQLLTKAAAQMNSQMQVLQAHAQMQLLYQPNEISGILHEGAVLAQTTKIKQKIGRNNHRNTRRLVEQLKSEGHCPCVVLFTLEKGESLT